MSNSKSLHRFKVYFKAHGPLLNNPKAGEDPLLTLDAPRQCCASSQNFMKMTTKFKYLLAGIRASLGAYVHRVNEMRPVGRSN